MQDFNKDCICEKLCRIIYPLSPFLPSSFIPPPSPPSLLSIPQDVTVLHHMFIDECFRRLDEVIDPTGGAGRTGSTGRNTSMLVTNAPRLCFKHRTLSAHFPLLRPKLPSLPPPSLFPSLPSFHSLLTPFSPLLNLPPPESCRCK